MHTSDIELTRFEDFRPTAFDQRGLGAADEDRDQRDWLVCPVSRQPKISTLFDDSNWDVQLAMIQESDPSGEDHEVHYFGHWTSDFEIVVVRPGSAAHDAARKIVASLANYPLLDDEDHSRREYEATLENIESELRRTTIVNDEGEEIDPADISGDLFSWFWNHDQSAVESCDGNGGYPSSEQVGEALQGLGYECDEDGGPWRK